MNNFNLLTVCQDEAIRLAEQQSGLEELDYNPSASDNDCDYSTPIPIRQAPGWSYVIFTACGETIGIRTADDNSSSEWKWIDP